MRRIKTRLTPLQHLSLLDGRWQVTGEDPQFFLRWRFGKAIPSGYYRIDAMGGEGLDQLTGASLYVDSGKGFNEAERIPLRFGRGAGSSWMSWAQFMSPAKRLRFDPSEGGDRPGFNVDSLILRPAQTPPSPHRPGPRGGPKVLLNLIRLLPGEHGAGGAGRVCIGLIRSLPEHVQLRVAIAPYHHGLSVSHPDVEFVILDSDDGASLGIHLEWCDCYVDPLNGLRPKNIPPNVCVIAILHDLQHMRLPQFFSLAERRGREAEYGYAAARADRLVAVSEYEKHNLQEFYDKKNVSVVYNSGFMAEDSGLDIKEVRRRRAVATERSSYLFYPAVPWAHKNHEKLVQAIALLAREGIRIPLVLTNTLGKTGIGERLSTLISMLGVADLVSQKSFLPEAELLDLTLGATAVVFPSLYEGFGIPLVDAMQLGVPIIASDAAAIPEICGDAAAYFTNASNAIALASDLRAFWRDTTLRNTLAEKGFRESNRFSASMSAAALARTIKQTIDEKRENSTIAQIWPKPAAPFKALSAFVIYDELSGSQRRDLSKISDINAFHAAIFGLDASVTVGLSVSLASDPTTQGTFMSARNLICFDDGEYGISFAAQEFQSRHCDGKCHIITHYTGIEQKYHPAQIRAISLALDLHPDAGYVQVVPDAPDVKLEELPDEVSGVLAYERLRREGAVRFDVAVRRDALPGISLGTFEFLSGLCTRERRLIVPEISNS